LASCWDDLARDGSCSCPPLPSRRWALS